MERSTLFGFDFISADDHNELLKELRQGIRYSPNELPLLITPNVDQVVKCSKPEFAHLKAQLRNAKYILPDGQPIVWVSKLLRNNKLKARLTGSDLFPKFWNQCIKDNSKVALFVPSEDVGMQLKKEYSQCVYSVANVINIDDKDSVDYAVEQCTRMCIEHQPDFLLYGIGFPKQELISLELIGRLKAHNVKMPLILLLGASFEFHVGIKKRSPVFLQRLGLEFAHRMFSEPKRMLRRYLIEDSKFIHLAVKELLN